MEVGEPVHLPDCKNEQQARAAQKEAGVRKRKASARDAVAVPVQGLSAEFGTLRSSVLGMGSAKAV